MKGFLLFRSANRWMLGSLIFVGVFAMGMVAYMLGFFNDAQNEHRTESLPTATKVMALGRLEPEGEITKLAAPLALDGDRILELRVKQGDRVKAGQIVAVLDSYHRLSDAVRQTQRQVDAAQAKLAQIRAGAKQGEILAQQATITRVNADRIGAIATQESTISRSRSEVHHARTEFKRFSQLYRERAISSSELDRKRLTLNTAQAQLDEAIAKQRQNQHAFNAQVQEARATLNRIAEVRPVDVRVAETEVETAISALDRAETELEQAYVRAPKAGAILKIHTRVGEKIATATGDKTAASLGIADLAQTSYMNVVAEVYQSDIHKVRTGQVVIITGQAVMGKLRGTVSEIGMQISRQNVFSNQPGENLDRRVIEVKIQLGAKDSQHVTNLTNLQVQTEIQL